MENVSIHLPFAIYHFQFSISFLCVLCDLRGDKLFIALPCERVASASRLRTHPPGLSFPLASFFQPRITRRRRIRKASLLLLSHLCYPCHPWLFSHSQGSNHETCRE